MDYYYFAIPRKLTQVKTILGIFLVQISNIYLHRKKRRHSVICEMSNGIGGKGNQNIDAVG
jgi:hypothetical protein